MRIFIYKQRGSEEYCNIGIFVKVITSDNWLILQKLPSQCKSRHLRQMENQFSYTVLLAIDERNIPSSWKVMTFRCLTLYLTLSHVTVETGDPCATFIHGFNLFFATLAFFHDFNFFP